MIRRSIAKLIMGVLSMALPMAFLTGCQTEFKTSQNNGDIQMYGGEERTDYVEGKELMCLVDTQEEAQKIADTYNIELVEFSYGVATFHTDENPNNVIAFGKMMGYPELSINGTMHTY